MKVNPLYRMIAILVLLMLVLPGAVSADDQDVGEFQRPIPAIPLQLGPTFHLVESATTVESAGVQPGANAPTANLPQERDAVGRYTVFDKSEQESAGVAVMAEPDALNACANYIQNGGFEADSSWLASPASNVRYSPYSYQGARSLYMTTANIKNAFLWQKVTLPAQAASLFVRIKAWQNMDAGESAWVSLYNADNTKRLWYGQITYTQGVWFDAYWWLPQQQFTGQTVNLVFEMFHDGDSRPSDLWLDNIELATCDTPPPTTTSDTRTIDIKISLRRSPSTTERASYENILRYAADAIYEMSNGKHFIGRVTFYQNGQQWHSAHVQWSQCQWPKAHVGGYWRREKLSSQEYISMGDIWPSDRQATAAGCANGSNLLTTEANRKRGGYVFAHEMGHYFYGLYDEYARIEEQVAIQQSVMSSQSCAESPGTCNDTNYLRWLNFSNSMNFNTNNAQHRLNDQYAAYKANAWDTLLRSPWRDPRDTFLNSKPRREFYPELAGVAPQPGIWPTIELPAASTTARSRLSFSWIPAVSAADIAGIAAIPYTATVYSVTGDTIVSPEPVLLIAQVTGEGSIARAELAVQVTAPNGAQTTLALRDDGIAPDYLANDGRYSGLLPYRQNGTYTIGVQFTNSANQAMYTTIGYEGGSWALGQLVGEGFAASAVTTVTISGYTSDDHADGLANATTLFSDNKPVRGQIDRAGDRDMFKATLSGDGNFVLRFSSFALGMQPRIKLWQSDGVTPIGQGEWTLIPEDGYYYYVSLKGPMGASFYTEISHVNQQATQGMYALSFGLPLAGEEAEERYRLFLPLIVR